MVPTASTTFLRSIAPSTSTALGANVLTDTSASFPLPDSATGRLGLIGLELNPNTVQGRTFTIVDNTATEIFTDLADGGMTDVTVASVGDTYFSFTSLDTLDILAGLSRASAIRW